MQAQYAEVERLFYERDRLVNEVLSVRHECEDHPDGQLVGKRQPGCEVDCSDHLQAEDQIVGGGEGDLGSPESHVRVSDVGETIEPLAFPLALAIEELEALNRSDALDEIRVLLRSGLDRRFGAQPQDSIEDEPDRGVEQERAD